MDIEKERKAFLTLQDEHLASMIEYYAEKNIFRFISVNTNLSIGVRLASLNYGWRMWLAAKQQAVPDGFVVVPVEPTKEMYLAGTHELTQIDFRDLHDNDSVTVYKAMIQEVQK